MPFFRGGVPTRSQTLQPAKASQAAQPGACCVGKLQRQAGLAADAESAAGEMALEPKQAICTL
eukprot:10373498-Heterocapsa_arctica.AAC.1